VAENALQMQATITFEKFGLSNVYVDFDHAGDANLANLGFAQQGLSGIDEQFSEGTEIVARMRIINTCPNPMAEGFLRMIAKSVGLTVDVRLIQNLPCWRASQRVHIPALS
jgi:hypothetical protein